MWDLSLALEAQTVEAHTMHIVLCSIIFTNTSHVLQSATAEVKKTSNDFLTTLWAGKKIQVFSNSPICWTRTQHHTNIWNNLNSVTLTYVLYTVAQLGSNLVTDICNSSLEVRINFCKKALHVHHFGYEFDLSHYLHLSCEQQDFWTKSPIPSKAGPFQADMFSCPPIIYRDMETNKEMFLPYIYSASRGLAHDAVFTFVQEKTSNTKYPFQYIKNINFKKLKKENSADITSYLEPQIRYKYASISLENLLGLQFHRTEMFKSKYLHLQF